MCIAHRRALRLAFGRSFRKSDLGTPSLSIDHCAIDRCAVGWTSESPLQITDVGYVAAGVRLLR